MSDWFQTTVDICVLDFEPHKRLNHRPDGDLAFKSRQRRAEAVVRPMRKTDGTDVMAPIANIGDAAEPVTGPRSEAADAPTPVDKCNANLNRAHMTVLEGGRAPHDDVGSVVGQALA
jgi:hypothetical protein